MVSMIDKLRAKIMSDVEEVLVNAEREKNYEWLLENKEDLINTHPSRWIAILDQRAGIVNYSLDYIFRTLRMSNELNSSMLFVFADEHHFTVVSGYGEKNNGD